jgi:hypothetical protein
MLRAFAALPFLYIVACLASIWMFVSGMLGWLGPAGHESAGNYAIALGVPWSLLLGLVFHPDSKTGLAILIASMAPNFHLLRTLAGALAMPEELPLGNIVRITNHAAAATWVVLTLLAAGSGIAWPRVATINFMATPFLLVPALLLFWRAKAFGAMSRSMMPANEPLLSLLRCEAVTAASILVVGLLLVAAAVSRVLGEGFPLFG